MTHDSGGAYHKEDAVEQTENPAINNLKLALVLQILAAFKPVINGKNDHQAKPQS